MRADSAIPSTAAVAVVAEDLDVLGEPPFDDPQVETCSYRLLLAVHSTIIVDMVDRQEFTFAFPAARALGPVVVEDFTEPFDPLLPGPLVGFSPLLRRPHAAWVGSVPFPCFPESIGLVFEVVDVHP